MEEIKKLTFSVNEELAKKFKEKCYKHGTTMTDVFRDYMRAYVKNNK